MTTKEVRIDPTSYKSRRQSSSDTLPKSAHSKPVAQVQGTKSSTNHYAKWVKQRVSCSKCTELFDEPHTLLCLHSLCGKCLRGIKLEVHGSTPGYVCPICEEFCDKESVRNNFLLTELLNFYLMMTQRGSITTCKQCHRTDPTHRCLDCKADFCSDCRKLHDGFELMRVSHRWISHADIGKRIVIDKLMFCEHHPKSLLKHNCLECDETICETCLSSHHANHANEPIDHTVKRIAPEMQSHQTTLESSLETADASVAAIKSRTAEICASVEKEAEDARKIHRKQIEKLNSDLIQLLSQFEELKSVTKRQGQALISDIELEAVKTRKAVTWVDTTMRIAQGTSLVQEFQSGVRNRVRNMAEQNRIAQLPKANTMHDFQALLIPQQQQLDDNNKIGHIVSKNQKYIVKISDQWQHDFKGLSEKLPVHVSTVKLGDGTIGRHFLYQNGELWIPFTADGHSSLRLFSYAGEELKTINLPSKIGRPNAIVQTKRSQSYLTESEFAAIASDTGVYSVTEKAHIVQRLDQGSFSDVCIHNGMLYALEYKRQQLLVYEFTDCGWTQVKTIDIKHAECGVNDTVNVSADRINVACWWGDEIHSYSMSGETLGQYREKRPLKGQKSTKGSKKSAVQISNPRLSGSDISGALLYCDSANRRIQMLSADRQWGLTVLQGLSIDPVHVIPKDQHGVLILAADNSLIHFNFE